MGERSQGRLFAEEPLRGSGAAGPLLAEQDESISRILGGHLATAFHAYIAPTGASELRTTAYETTRRRDAGGTGRRWGCGLSVSERFVTLVDGPKAQADLADLLSGKLQIPGLELRPLDRWNMVGKLISSGSPLAGEAFSAQQKADQSTDGLKSAWAVQRAGRPDATVKREYFEAVSAVAQGCGREARRLWLTRSPLRPFNAWNQQELNRALSSPRARSASGDQARPQDFLSRRVARCLSGRSDRRHGSGGRPRLAGATRIRTQSLRRKVLENTDDLERTVRIRRKFGDE